MTKLVYTYKEIWEDWCNNLPPVSTMFLPESYKDIYMLDTFLVGGQYDVENTGHTFIVTVPHDLINRETLNLVRDYLVLAIAESNRLKAT